jgi:hypothetical protein
LLIVKEHSEILLENLVYSFRLTVRLRMEGCTEVEFYTKPRAECSPKLGGEDWSTVRYDILRDSVKAEYESEHGGELFRAESFFFEGKEMCHLCQSAHDDHDAIKVAGRWKLDYGVDGYGFPRPSGYRQWLKESNWLMSRTLITLASLASSDISVYVCSHTRPIIVSSDKGIGFRLSHMSRKRRVVTLMENSNFEIRVVGNVDQIIV